MVFALTAKETDILAFIYGYIGDNGYPPTRQEIAGKFSITKQGANYFIIKLISKKKLKINRNKWRNIEII
jgi:SOS-response transcriptional repressor LexA